MGICVVSINKGCDVGSITAVGGKKISFVGFKPEHAEKGRKVILKIIMDTLNRSCDLRVSINRIHYQTRAYLFFRRICNIFLNI